MVEVRIDQKLCKLCGICIEICPRNAIKLNSFLIVNGNCNGCKFCEYHCPDFAIEVIKDEDEINSGK